MKITTYLSACKTTPATQDATCTEKETSETAYLCFRLRDKERDVKVRTDVSVLGAYWDNTLQGYRPTRRVSSAERLRMERLVRDIIQELEKVYRREKADAAWMRDVIDRVRCAGASERPSPPTFVDRYEQFLREHAMAPNSHRIYSSTLARLKRCEAYKRDVEGRDDFHFYVENITAFQYKEFCEFIQNEHLLFRENEAFYAQQGMRGVRRPKPMARICVAASMRHLRTVHHWCIKQGYTNNLSCDQFSYPSPTPGTPVYITLHERDSIYYADLSGECMSAQLARDVFVFQSLIGCRIGDLWQLTYDNIHNGILTFIPHKTMGRSGHEVSIPLSNKAQRILQRNFSDGKRLFPHCCVTTNITILNLWIKRVFALCGLNRMVTVRNPRTGADEQKPLCEVASSHMARRTFIGNLYKRVKDPALISSMTGHTNGSRAFARYRDIDDEIKTELVNLIN